MAAISVVIADQKRANRSSYLAQLQPEEGICVVGEAGTRSEVMAAMKLQPNILVVEWHMCAVDGSALLHNVRQQSPDTKVILVTHRTSSIRIVEALCQGAHGYLARTAVRPFLVKAVRVVDGGEVWVPRAMVPLLIAVLTRLGMA